MGNSKHEDHFGGRLIMRYFFILLLSSSIFCSTDSDVVQKDNVKIVEAGEDVNFTCPFPRLEELTKAWFKQSAYGNLQQIVSLHSNQKLSWNTKFDKTNRFNVAKEDGYFNLTILKTKLSDSATYYCIISAYQTIGISSETRLLVKDTNRNPTLHQSLIDTVDPGDSVNLQCSISTESCAGDHSVYWFKQSSGDSEGVLYIKGARNGRCKNSPESQTQSCVYSLHKNNISHSDPVIYYCAVATCGQILLGRGTQLNIRESDAVNPTLIALGILNIMFLAYAIYVTIKLRKRDNQGEDILILAAQNDLIAEGVRVKFSEEHSFVKYSMITQKLPIKRFRP